MKLLLDTCAFLWALHEPDRLSTPARKALESPTTIVYVSVVSFWEISLKAGMGKLRLEGINPEDYPACAHKAGWEIHTLAPDVAASVGRLHRMAEHRDPFDRLLIWTAIKEGFTIVSSDKALANYTHHGLKICW